MTQYDRNAGEDNYKRWYGEQWGEGGSSKPSRKRLFALAAAGLTALSAVVPVVYGVVNAASEISKPKALAVFNDAAQIPVLSSENALPFSTPLDWTYEQKRQDRRKTIQISKNDSIFGESFDFAAADEVVVYFYDREGYERPLALLPGLDGVIVGPNKELFIIPADQVTRAIQSSESNQVDIPLKPVGFDEFYETMLDMEPSFFGAWKNIMNSYYEYADTFEDRSITQAMHKHIRLSGTDIEIRDAEALAEFIRSRYVPGVPEMYMATNIEIRRDEQSQYVAHVNLHRFSPSEGRLDAAMQVFTGTLQDARSALTVKSPNLFKSFLSEEEYGKAKAKGDILGVEELVANHSDGTSSWVVYNSYGLN